MVPDVDAKYESFVRQLGMDLIHDIKDRDYGLRDFTLRGPDGIGVRFGTYLKDIKRA